MAEQKRGISPDMELPFLLIVLGIILALLVHQNLGIACIVIGLILLIWPGIASRH